MANAWRRSWKRSETVFEVDHDRATTVRETLADCSPAERIYLVANPVDLGVRCEAYLSGTAPEWLVDYLSDDDQCLLGALVISAREAA